MSDWISIDDPPTMPEEDTHVVEAIVTDGNRFTKAYYTRLAGWKWLKTHVVPPSDATHYLIPELP